MVNSLARSASFTNIRNILITCLAIYAMYVPAALYLKLPTQNPPEGALFRLGNCRKLVATGFLYVCPAPSLRKFEDTVSDDQRSPILIYENDKPLNYWHSVHHDIEMIGMGRYSHWKELGILLSTSDNSDPTTNGRYYWAVYPNSQRP